MTDEEIKEFAKTLFKEACSEGGLRAVEEEYFKFKPIIDASGDIIFEFVYSGTPADVIIAYRPLRFFEQLVRTMDAGMDEYIKILASPDIPNPQPLLLQIWSDNIKDTAMVLLGLMTAEFCESIIGLPLLAHEVANYIRAAEDGPRSDTERLDHLGQIVMRRNRHRFARIVNYENQHREWASGPPFLFSVVYEEKLALWKDIKRCYQAVKSFKNSVSMVKASYPELPDDLIERLADPDPYTSMPSSIALEDTARYMRVPSSKGSKSSLDRYLRDSRQARKNVSDEEIQTAREHFEFVRAKLEERNLKLQSAINASIMSVAEAPLLDYQREQGFDTVEMNK